LFSAMERVGTTPSVLSTLRDRSRYAAAPNSTELLSPNSVSKSVSAPSMHQAQLNLPTAPAPSTPSTASNLVRGLCLYSYTAATAKVVFCCSAFFFGYCYCFVLHDRSCRFEREKYWLCVTKTIRAGGT
jgi:hypothetical protein